MTAILLVADRDIKPGPEPQEVLAYWRAKKLKIGFDHRDVWREEHDWAFTAAKVMREDVLDALRAELERAFDAGLPFKRFTKDIEPRMQKLGWWAPHDVTDPETGKVVTVDPPKRLRTIYETNMRTSRAVGQWDRIQRTKETRPFLLYQVGPSARHREQHLAWHGLLLPVDDPFWSYAFPPNGWGCFLGGTHVSGEFVGGSKAWYAGEAIEIETESGARLSVTPNHPVLTARGWLPAGALHVGDDCVCHSSEVELVRRLRSPLDTARAVDDQHRPALVEDVFDSLAAHGRRSAQVSPLDFHGEASRFVGEVDVVGSYIQLMHDREPALLEHPPQPAFARSNAGLILVERLGLELALGGRRSSAGSRGEGGLRNAPALSVTQPLVAFVRRVGATAQLDAVALKKPSDRSSRAACFARELQQRHASTISSDKIRSVRRFEFRGHVYDLESKSGWLLANGLAASNCKCSTRTVSEREHKALVRDGVLGPEPEPELDDEGLPTGHVSDQRIPVITKAPDVPLVPWENKRTGEVQLVRQGIDPGFDKRPGEGRRAAIGTPTPPAAPAPARAPRGTGPLAVHASARADVERYRARAEARIAKKGLSLRKRGRPAIVDQTLKEIDPQLKLTQDLWTGLSGGGGGWYSGSHGPIADVGKVLTGTITQAELKATADVISSTPEDIVQWARARYAVTQAALQKRIEDSTLGADVDADGFVVLYRGVKHEQGDQLLAARAGRDKEVALELRPVSSWSHKREVAEYFAGSKGAVVKSRVHISRFFGQYEQEQAAMRIGGDFESEWIVIADPDGRLVLSTQHIESRDEEKKP